jgi:hypothetical protein
LSVRSVGHWNRICQGKSTLGNNYGQMLLPEIPAAIGNSRYCLRHAAAQFVGETSLSLSRSDFQVGFGLSHVRNIIGSHNRHRRES